MTNNQFHEPMNLVQRLIEANEESERNFFTAAEQADNRGVKLLLKANAQQRAEFARQLAHTAGMEPTSNAWSNDQSLNEEGQPAPSGFLRRGWTSLTSAMVIQRRYRQQKLISALLSSETDALQLYEQAVDHQALDDTLRATIRQQSERIRMVYENLGALAKTDGDRRMVLRLFDHKSVADAAVQRLQQTGQGQHQILTIPIEKLPVYYGDQEQRTESTREAIVTGGLVGTVFGALLGAIYGVYHWIALSDILPGFLATTAVGVIWELTLYGALIGLFFSVIFSTLVTRNMVETDEYLYEEGLHEGKVLVVVFADKEETPTIRRTIGLKHEHEVEPVPA